MVKSLSQLHQSEVTKIELQSVKQYSGSFYLNTNAEKVVNTFVNSRLDITIPYYHTTLTNL